MALRFLQDLLSVTLEVIGNWSFLCWGRGIHWLDFGAADMTLSLCHCWDIPSSYADMCVYVTLNTQEKQISHYLINCVLGNSIKMNLKQIHKQRSERILLKK